MTYKRDVFIPSENVKNKKIMPLMHLTKKSQGILTRYMPLINHYRSNNPTVSAIHISRVEFMVLNEEVQKISNYRYTLSDCEYNGFSILSATA